jgi:hypothetical protein
LKYPGYDSQYYLISIQLFSSLKYPGYNSPYHLRSIQLVNLAS